MFKILRVAFLFIFLLLQFGACKKYPNGPGLSLEPKIVRLNGKWVMKEYYINGINKSDSITFIFPRYQMNIELNKEYTVVMHEQYVFDHEEHGTWEWIDKKKSLHFKYKGNGKTGLYGFPAVQPTDPGEYDYRILKLKDKELWLKRLEKNGDVCEFHFEPVKK